MAIVKRGKVFHLYIRPFLEKQITVKTLARSKTEARQMELMLMSACRSGDYTALDPTTREVCLRMFRNQGWEIPLSLAGDMETKEELTAWKAAKIFLTYPEVLNSAKRERYQQCLAHVVEKLGKDYAIKRIWIPDIKRYQIDRLNDGAAPGTVNREKSTLSKMLQVLVELRYMDVNPARLVKNLSEKSGERQVYLSCRDFEGIMRGLPRWLVPIAQTAYYTGMRQGEVLGLRRAQLNLGNHMMLLAPEDVKEADWKRIPIHRELVPILEDALKVRAIGSDLVFPFKNEPISRFALQRPWKEAGEELGFDPLPRFHDLRHTWKTNARRSGMDPEIRESILGHWFREKSVSERYGRISDAELIQAIDLMTFDHGETEILVSAAKKQNPGGGAHLDREKMLATR
ncbi:MAG: tyrosine-type recombinase/integrase [Desulfomonilaceae bacterium]